MPKLKRYAKITKLLQQRKTTGVVDFLSKYNKNSILWSNKLAYLAGLIDGEGYIKIEKHGTIRIAVGMTDRVAIYWIKEHFGGNIRLQFTKKGKKFFVWRMNQGKDLLYLMLLVIPFLKTKRKKVISAFYKMLKKFGKLYDTLGQGQKCPTL